MWNETAAQKNGLIRRDTKPSVTAGKWILSGPHFYVGNPFNKTPREVCTLNSHYDILDLTSSSEKLGKTAGKDLLADKTTYPKLLGMEESKKRAFDLVEKAKKVASTIKVN